MPELTHLDGRGRARMVDVGAKLVTRREAVAHGEIRMSLAAARLLRSGRNAKGNALHAAVLAGTLAAKRVDELIPLCHTLPIDAVEIDFKLKHGRLIVRAGVRARSRTGVEMEALAAVTMALLTVYDMCKSADKSMTIGPIYLERKSGGRSELYVREAGQGGKSSLRKKVDIARTAAGSPGRAPVVEY